jgi:rhamnogalacturonyl hydrolase YesR
VNRNDFLRLSLATTAGLALGQVGHSVGTAAPRPDRVPPNIAALLDRALRVPPERLNTDWFGAGHLEGILRWSGRGHVPARQFAQRWLEFHLQNDPKLSDEAYRNTYEGPKGRVMRKGPLPHTTYAGNLSVAFPCHALYEQTRHEAARRVCLDVADTILHHTARDGDGMMAHDDGNFTKYRIPDVGYFAVRGMGIGAALADPVTAEVYQHHALVQARTFFDVFFDRERGLTKTGLFNDLPGTTYWCRASGWLALTLTSLLRHLPATHPDFGEFTRKLTFLADGLVRVQGLTGGLTVWTDELTSPEEVTGTAMCVGSLREAVRKGWLPEKPYVAFLNQGWGFVQRCVNDQGQITRAYTGWAVPAQKKQLLIDHKDSAYVVGMLLVTADECLR